MYDYSMVVEDLLEWYKKNARDLPWRKRPDPYYVWVSEIMLQQTRVEAVKGYFQRFIQALPDIEALANASEEQLLKLWEGLGYYNRVRNMQQAAITIMEEFRGEMPKQYEQLLKLKGIGSYTAGAIASIAFGERVPAVDGNVLRVMKRLSAGYEDIMKASVKNALQRELESVVPKQAGAFNQAIMDLGATICIPNGQPLCAECPLEKYCEAKKLGIQTELPVKSKSKPRRLEEKTILLMEYQGKYAIRKRAEKGLLAGLWELPAVEGKMDKKEIERLVQEQQDREIVQIKELGNAKHVFSHVEWDMTGYHIQLQKPILNQEYTWAGRQDLKDKYAIPTAFSAFLKECGLFGE